MKRSLVIIVFACIAFTACNKSFEVRDNPIAPVDSLPVPTTKLVKYIVSHSAGRSIIDSLTFTYDSSNRMISLRSSWGDTTKANELGSETYSFNYTGNNVRPDSYIYFYYQNYNGYNYKTIHSLEYVGMDFILDSSIVPHNRTSINLADNLVTFSHQSYPLLDSVSFDANKNAIQYIYYDHARFFQKFTYSNNSYANPIYNPYIGNILTQDLVGFGLMSKKLPDTQFIDDPDGIRTYTIEYILNNWGSVQKSITKEGSTVVNVTTYEYY